jgi:HTH-type transcriptional regulator/antitoxin HipB
LLLAGRRAYNRPVREDYVDVLGDPARLGAIVRAERRRQGMTIDDLALTADLGPRVIGELERGKPTVQLDVVRRIFEALRLRVNLDPRDE